MGLAHVSYAPNFQSLLEALALLARERPDLRVSFVSRSGTLPIEIRNRGISIEILPLEDEDSVQRDLDDVDLLYLPLPFERAYESFTRFQPLDEAGHLSGERLAYPVSRTCMCRSRPIATEAWRRSHRRFSEPAGRSRRSHDEPYQI